MINFPDGSFLVFRRDGWEFYPNGYKDYLKYYNSGNSNSCSDHKYFNFAYSPYSTNIYLYHKGIEPYYFSYNGDPSELKTNERYGCKKDVPGAGRAYCTALIQQNG